MIGALPHGVTNSGTSNTDSASTEEHVSMELDNEDDVWNEALVEMTEPDGNDADDSGPAPPETIEMHNIHIDDGWGCPSDHPATATTEQLSVVLGVRDDGWCYCRVRHRGFRSQEVTTQQSKIPRYFVRSIVRSGKRIPRALWPRDAVSRLIAFSYVGERNELN
eukprot:SAG11_NODE_2572_length_3210_cov_18.286725_7_plen_164_part_00